MEGQINAREACGLKCKMQKRTPSSNVFFLIVYVRNNVRFLPVTATYVYIAYNLYGKTHGAGKAHGSRAAGHHSYSPNHILDDMNIALALVCFTAYSRSAWHFDPTHAVGFKQYIYGISVTFHK